MAIEELIKLSAALVAAFTGIWNVWWQTKGKNDRFLVGLDSIIPTIEQETFIHVVSLSDHSILLKDWGFIKSDGKFISCPLGSQTDSLDNDILKTRGSTHLLSRNDSFEMGYIKSERPFGAYAISVTQKRPRLHFESSMPYWRRIVIILRLWLQPNYFAW